MPSREWYYDASTSPLLRFVAHLSPAALGGALLLAAVAAATFVIANPTVLLSSSVLLLVVLLLVGGPFSLLYLWPMLTDSDQRPSTTEFEGGRGFPFTVKSVSIAALSGSAVILSMAALGVPFDVVYWLAVGCVFSPILVAAVTTHGRLEAGTLTLNRTEIPLSRVESVRSVRVRGFVLAWISYVRRSGLFLPRLVVVPVAEADGVLSTLEDGIDAEPEIEPPDRAVRAALFAAGGLCLAVAALAYGSIAEPSVRRNAVVGFGGFGSLCWLAGLRGV